MGVLIPSRSKYGVGEELLLHLGLGFYLKVSVLEVLWDADNEQAMYRVISRVMNPDLDESQIVASKELMREKSDD